MIAIVSRTEYGWVVSTTSPSKQPYSDLTRVRSAQVLAREYVAEHGGGRVITLTPATGWVADDQKVPAR